MMSSDRLVDWVVFMVIFESADSTVTRARLRLAHSENGGIITSLTSDISCCVHNALAESLRVTLRRI